MRQTSKRCILLLAFLLTACQQPSHKDTFLVFGTTVQITLPGVSQSKGQQASAALHQLFMSLHKRWHAWEQGGLLANINLAIAQGEPITLDAEVVRFLKKVQTLSVQSGGLFNPGVGKLVALWGFHADNPKSQQPTQQQIDAYTRPPLSLASLRFSDNTLSSQDPRLQLDVGAVAKGYAVDLAVATLQQQGITNAVVNAGGDLRVLGNKAGKPWQVGVRNPAGGTLGGLALQHGEAVFSSGDYARRYRTEKGQAHHIIDPHTGKPSEGLRAVTVVLPKAADAGLRADALATALMVAGPMRWQQLAEKMGVDTALVIDNKGKLWMTKKMKKRFEPL